MAGFQCDKTKLRNIYCSVVRSILEYSSVVHGPMITKYQSNRLANVQKSFLRSIYGYKLNYEQLLQESGLETLTQRRDNTLIKCARKSPANTQFSHWFPFNTNRTSSRRSKAYEEKHASSDRLYNSPLFKMRRLLNNTPDSIQNTSNVNYSDLSHLFNAP